MNLIKKDHQFEKFKDFKKYYELLTGNKVKEFRTDNGREYLPENYL